MPTVLKIASNRNNMHLVEEAIDTICAQLKLDEANYGKIYVAITEAVYNAMLHGNKLDASKKITLSYEIKPNDKLLTVTVTDEGQGFNPIALPDPTTPENILKESGRGVFLIKKMATRCRFNSVGNELVMEFDY